VGAVSGDARRAICLAGKALARHPVVGIKEMDGVISGAVVRAPGIATLPVDMRLVLLTMHNLMAGDGGNSGGGGTLVVSRDKLVETCCSLARTIGLATSMSYIDVNRAVAGLLSMGVVGERARNGLALAAVHRSDVQAVLSEDPLLSRFLVK
jgi:hypothetical protein